MTRSNGAHHRLLCLLLIGFIGFSPLGQVLSAPYWASGVPSAEAFAEDTANYDAGNQALPYLESAMAQLQAQRAAAEQQQQQQMPMPMVSEEDDEQQQEGIQQQIEEDTQTDDDQSTFVLQLPPNIGHVAGLAMDARNRLVLFHRSGRVWDEYSFNERNQFNRSLDAIPNATLAVMDSENGSVLEHHGAGLFYMPHGLTIDAEGNLWLTDVGTHQVHKLDKQFRTLMTLGEKLVPGSDAKHFCKPTDVAVASTGEFFVADGYCNSRIMKFDRDGKLLSQFGRPNMNDPPKAGEFFVPHSIALIEDLNLVCVADRENERIQCFSAGLEGGGGSRQQKHHRRAYVPTGTFVTKAENIGRVYAILEKDHFLTGVTSRDRAGQLESQVFVMDINTGKANTFAKGLENAHAVALSNVGNAIFVSQLEPSQIVKFIGSPAPAAPADAEVSVQQ